MLENFSGIQHCWCDRINQLCHICIIVMQSGLFIYFYILSLFLAMSVVGALEQFLEWIKILKIYWAWSCYYIGIMVCLAHKDVLVFQTRIWTSGHRHRLKICFVCLFHLVSCLFAFLCLLFSFPQAFAAWNIIQTTFWTKLMISNFVSKVAKIYFQSWKNSGIVLNLLFKLLWCAVHWLHV